MSITIWDIAIVVIYFLILSAIGYKSRFKQGKETSGEEYILAGRRVTLPFFVASLVATWYGNIMGMGEFVYNNGFVAFFCFGLPYYIAAFFFATFLAEKIRKSSSKTIPEQITNAFGAKAGNLSTLIILIITIPAAYILMLGSLLQMFTGWSLWLSLIIGTAVSLGFIYHGGLRSDIIANTAQFIFMYVGFGALLYFSITRLGSFGEMFAALPSEHTTPLGNLSLQYVLAWYIIAFQTFIDPSFHQRCAAAESPKTAKKGIYVSIIFWVVFDFLTLFTGLYAVAYYSIEPSLNAYPELADKILPPVWEGLFLVALLATVMSTLKSYALLSAATIGNDILRKLFLNIKLSTTLLSRVGLLATGAIGIVMALAIPSAIDLIYKTSSIAVPALIFPLFISYSKRYEIAQKDALKIMILTLLLTTFWTISNEVNSNINLQFLEFTSNFEPMIPGIFLSIILGLFYVRKKNE